MKQPIYNDDGEIDEGTSSYSSFDRLFGGPDGPGEGPFVPDVEDWLGSDEAEDITRTVRSTMEDYELLRSLYLSGPGPDGPFVPDFEDWLASDEAEDLNEDGEIDEADYELLLEFVFGGPDGPVPATVLSFPILRIGWPAKKPRI